MLTSAFAPGQRVVAPAEPQLGLGVVTEVGGRRFQVLFPKADVQRTYSSDTSAVHRFKAKVGDTITTQSGEEYRVSALLETDGIVSYQTTDGGEVSEMTLSVDLKHSDPFSALAVGKPGSPRTFVSRVTAHNSQSFGRSQEHRGLGSARVELLPHQLFVTERVSQMWRPRVLLADEVGLGKTIEAGLIGIRLAALGRARSVAVVAPRALVGQWLAEFYRRFARPLTLFDAELEELPQDVLIPADDLDFLPADFQRELLIVDEAHHYYDDEALKVLAGRSGAVLFLTATPSLGGEESLFRLLNQLDPWRYPDADALKAKGGEWAQVADLARRVESGENEKTLEREFQKAFPGEADLAQLAAKGESEELLQRLVDRHGLGRSLIRNRRARLHDLFSGRDVVSYELEDDLGLFLIDHLRELKSQGKKVLVMVESTEDVNRWARLLNEKTTLSVARFDETMSLLERDRQAAWFNRVVAAPGEEEPASVLLCSEVGGEGRNFQVAHHLILLDLPRHPDKLEQRIGRLDRIGQTERVIVHVPLPQGDDRRAVRFAWLHDGLNAFARPLAEGQIAYEEFGEELKEFEKRGIDHEEFGSWLQRVRLWTEKAQERAEQSVDPLIDRMSYSPQQAQDLAAKAAAEQEAMSQHLQEVLPDLLDSLGVMLEARSEKGLYFIKSGDMMFVEALPGLPPGGALVTFDRTLANRRDDVEFLHFEHRLVRNTLDLILDEGVGKATAARWKGAPKTTVCFQFLFVLEIEGPEYLSLSRYLPAQTQVVTGDLAAQVVEGWELPGGIAVEERALERLGPDVVETLLVRTQDLRPRLRAQAEELLESKTSSLKAQAAAKAESFFAREAARLQHLRENQETAEVVEQALQELESQHTEVLECLKKADWRFDAVRMILCQE